MRLTDLPRPRPLDLVVAVLLMAVCWYEVLVSPIAEDLAGGPVWLDLVAVTLGTAPLAWRRHYPFAVATLLFGVLAARSLVYEPLELYPVYIALFFATYGVAAYCSFRDALLSAGIAALSFTVAAQNGSGTDSAPDPLAFEVLYGLVFAAGRAVATGNARARKVHEARDRHTAEAVAAERARIAREMHDVVSHSLAAIVMQSGGAQNVIDDDPARAKAALGRIEGSARRGLDEMRRLLGMLGADSAELAPQPGLAVLPELVEEVRAAGVDVTAEVDVDPATLPTTVDVSAYRIVQEALTNVMKHAGRCRAHVVVRRDGDDLLVEVTDDGAGVQDEEDGAGHGLPGMRERARLLGGTVLAGPARGRGFTVTGRLPL
jgi:signal transduction histidine kinase